MTGGWAGGVSWMTDIGVGQGGVAKAQDAETQQVKQSVEKGVPKHLSANALVGCALVHTLRDSATLGSRMCLAHLQWRPALTHLPQESVSLEHHSMWMDLHTGYHETHQADRDQSMSAHLCHDGNRRDHTEVERDFQLL